MKSLKKTEAQLSRAIRLRDRYRESLAEACGYLRIIREKRVNVHYLLESKDANEYNKSLYTPIGFEYHLTQEEFDELKKILK